MLSSNALADLLSRQQSKLVAANDPRDTASHAAHLRWTPRPRAGFPEQRGRAPGSLFLNQAPHQVGKWLAMTEPKCALTVFGRGALDHALDKNSFPVFDHVLEELRLFLGSDDVRVGIPIAIVAPDRPNSPPFSFLIYGITDRQLSRLLHQRVLCSEKIILLLSALSITYQDILLSFEGIPTTDVTEVHDWVVDTLRAHSDTVLDLAAATPKLHRLASDDLRFQALADSVQVESIKHRASGGVTARIFNVFINTQPPNATLWLRWQDALFSLSWEHDYWGMIRLRYGNPCRGCRSAEHFVGICPLRVTDSWHDFVPPAIGKLPSPGDTAPNLQDRRRRGTARPPGRPPRGNPRDGPGPSMPFRNRIMYDSDRFSTIE